MNREELAKFTFNGRNCKGKIYTKVSLINILISIYQKNIQANIKINKLGEIFTSSVRDKITYSY